MSLLSRLLGRGNPAPPPAPEPPQATVVIPDDLAGELTAGGVELTGAVVATLRAHLEAQRKAAEAEARGEKIPFWLRRDRSESDIEDELRERVTQRRAGEEEARTGVKAGTAAHTEPAAGTVTQTELGAPTQIEIGAGADPAPPEADRH